MCCVYACIHHALGHLTDGRASEELFINQKLTEVYKIFLHMCSVFVCIHQAFAHLTDGRESEELFIKQRLTEVY